MTKEDELKRFKKQYVAEWPFLISDEEFAKAWNSQNIVRCGELAPILIDGNAESKLEHKVLKAAKVLKI
jgi:hypothetical protein